MINNVLHHSSSIASQHISPAEGKTLHPATGGNVQNWVFQPVPSGCRACHNVVFRDECVQSNLFCAILDIWFKNIQVHAGYGRNDQPWNAWSETLYKETEEKVRDINMARGIRVWEHQNKLFQQQTRASWHLQHVFCISLVLKGHYSNTNSNICMCFGRR